MLIMMAIFMYFLPVFFDFAISSEVSYQDLHPKVTIFENFTDQNPPIHPLFAMIYYKIFPDKLMKT